MAKSSRVPPVVGAIPLVGDLMKQADSQAQWLQDLVEQNARLLGQMPATIKSFNDSLTRFNQTVAKLDKVVSRIDATTAALVGPLEQIAPQLSNVPDLVESLLREAGPALRAATDTQKQVALLTATLERVLALLNDLPGAGLVRRFATGRLDDPAPPAPPA